MAVNDRTTSKMLVWIPSASLLFIKTGLVLTSVHSVKPLIHHRSKVTADPASPSKPPTGGIISKSRQIKGIVPDFRKYVMLG